MKLLIKLVLAALIILTPALSKAQSLYGDFVKPPTDIQRGIYMGTDSGFVFFMNTSGAISNPGYSLSFFLGYDISKFISIEGRFRAAINSGINADPINGGIYSFIGNGIVRFFYPFKRVYPFIDIGSGIFFTSPDYSTGVSQNYDMEFGIGAEYFTYQRHFSLALRNSFIYVPGQLPEAIIISLMLKYTF